VADRDVSWLEFNERVLSLASAPDLPLLERVKYLAIAAQNLDELFQIRLPSRQRSCANGSPSPDINVALDSLRQRVNAVVADQYQVWARLHRDLAAVGITILEHGTDLTADSDLVDAVCRDAVQHAFDRLIPALRPVWLRAGDAIPHIASRAVYLAGWVGPEPQSGLVLVRLPPLITRLIELTPGRFAYVEDIIRADASLFRLDGRALHTFRVTRDATLALDASAELRAAMEWQLHQRDFGPATRLEVEAAMPLPLRELLRACLGVDSADVIAIDGPLDLAHTMQVAHLPRAELRQGSRSPHLPPQLADAASSMFARLRRGDVLVHHPYESFDDSVTALVRSAADDPLVTQIKHTLYRTSSNSPVVEALRDAAQAGKSVHVIVEAKARFDERANLAWARRMEASGVCVHFGAPELKVHAKLALIRRDDSGGARWYWHTGTGNYNPETARIYEDLGMLSANDVTGDALSAVFDAAAGITAPPANDADVIAAPWYLRDRLRALIVDQAARGPRGRIVLKANALTDTEIIGDLYDASRAGVPIDLIVRGICCLRPGVAGQSATISVRSIVGRYLEHSRVWQFGSGDAAQLFVGSADLMPRNLDRRVEVMTIVRGAALRARLARVLTVLLDDDVRAWSLGPDGWSAPPKTRGIEAHVVLHERP
jgi:polyphosphate kinase